jgi:hypothetical protein
MLVVELVQAIRGDRPTWNDPDTVEAATREALKQATRLATERDNLRDELDALKANATDDNRSPFRIVPAQSHRDGPYNMWAVEQLSDQVGKWFDAATEKPAGPTAVTFIDPANGRKETLTHDQVLDALKHSDKGPTT